MVLANNFPPAGQPVHQQEPVQPDWYAAVVDQIKVYEHSFYKQPAGKFRVANTENKLGFMVSPAGFSVHNIKQEALQKQWQVNFSLLGIGRQKFCWMPDDAYTVQDRTTSIIYQYDAVDIEYQNNHQGLRQNFIVKERPSGKGKLSVMLELSGDLQASLLSKQQLAFYKPGKKSGIVFLYEDLKVWDANHHYLNATMKLKGDELTLEVDDKDAVYPVTIDPINKSPEWNTSIEGVASATLTQLQLQAALYGYAVSYLGDVNGDGFGDVAVSAPALVDIFSGTGTLASVGAVFVFYGSTTGFSTTPDKALQPNTAVAGAMFGLSVEGGDVTGDGLSDVIVGAPLDQYQTTASTLLGSTTVTVKAGKVYLYRSENFAGVNPTPFLQIRLQGSTQFNIATNTTTNLLFGYSLAVTEDLNGDNISDLVIGTPAYVGVNLLSVQNGAAFVYYSSNLATTSPVSLQVPSPSLLGLISLPVINSSGLLFGYSVDGVGDYNNDGYPDVVVGAPAGIDLSSLGGLLTGQVLGGSAYVYYGTGAGVNNNIGAQLIGSPSGLLGNAANLFGYKVKGVRAANGDRNGNVLIGAPVGGTIPNLLGLTIQTGNVHVFKRKTSSPSGAVTSDQQLESPRSSSILEVLGTLDVNALFGFSLDNAYDINCDGNADLVVGEPLSSGTNITALQANAVGGAAYVFLGDGTGGYNATPVYDASVNYGDEFLSVNAISLFGYSVAGVRFVQGPAATPRILVGSPAGALDFDNSVLNLGSTLGLLLDFSILNNGLGKAYSFNPDLCTAGGPLPVTLLDFKAKKQEQQVTLYWSTASEVNINGYTVQRSMDGVNFKDIGLVMAYENSTENNYQFPDQRPLTGTAYYRLKILDKDEQLKRYSKTVSVSFNTVGNTHIVVAPNPVTDRIRIQLSGLANGQYRIELRNVAGHLQQASSIVISSPGQVQFLDRSASLKQGIYWLTVIDRNNKKIGTTSVLVK